MSKDEERTHGKNMEHTHGCVPLISAIVFGFTMGWLLSMDYYRHLGHSEGVRDAIEGRYIMVQTPDSTSVAVKNKEKKP